MRRVAADPLLEVHDPLNAWAVTGFPGRELAAALPVGDLVEIPGLAHPLADEPGVAPTPKWELAREVDRLASEWLTRHVT
jgi:hypothetical protein